MTMLRRAEPTGAPTAVFTQTELALLDSTTSYAGIWVMV